jgi:hypothetical protein
MDLEIKGLIEPLQMLATKRTKFWDRFLQLPAARSEARW